MSGDRAIYGFQILGTLGQGAEGEVFRAFKDGQRYVVKIFYNLSGSEADLEAYCERVRTPEAGFFPVSLIYEAERLVGLYYSYAPLFNILGALYRHSARVAQAVLSQYCFSQAYLMSKHSLEMLDGRPQQFLLGRNGQLYYVDYGSTIVRADNDWCRTRGYTVFSFLQLLFELCGMMPDLQTRRPGFDYGRPCALVSMAQQEALCRCSPWTRPVVERIRQADAEIFLDPDFYTWVAGLYERVVPYAKWLVGADRVRRASAGWL